MWMKNELSRGKSKLRMLLNDYGQRIIIANRKREKFKMTAVDTRLVKENMFVYNNIYANYGLVSFLLIAIERWTI